MNNLRCRPGDLAIVVGATNDAGRQFIGQIVEVLRPNDFASWWDWRVRCIGFRLKGREEVGAMDYCLRPLRGDPDEQAEREREVVA